MPLGLMEKNVTQVQLANVINEEAIDSLNNNLPKSKKKRNEIYLIIEGKQYDNKILGWIIIVYICLGFLGITGDGDECIPTYWYACQEF